MVPVSARRETVDARGSRAKILIAAGRVLIKKGFRLATMEDIATAAEVGVGTLYHYFKGKEQLFTALLTESAELLNEQLRAAAAKPLPPSLGLLAINRAYVDYFADHPDFFRLLMFVRSEGAPWAGASKLRKRFERLVRQSLELLTDKVREGQAGGIFRHDLDPEAAAVALWASYNGVFLAATNGVALEATGVGLEQLLSTAAHLHFTGLRAGSAIGLATPDPTSTPPPASTLRDIQEVMRGAPWIDPATIFTGMASAFRPARARGVRETYEYQIDGPRGGVWTVRVEDETIEIHAGAAKSPTVVFGVSDRNFVRLVTGEVEASDLIGSGELAISGSLKAAAILPTLFV